MLRCRIVYALSIGACFLQPLSADEVRYFEKDGVTYRETRQTVQRPVCEVQMQTATQTVCQEQFTTEYRAMVRTWLVPITEYRPETYLENRWNPFLQPYYATRWVPTTRWEQRTETVRVPVTCRRLVPQTQTVQVPTPTQRMVSQEIITRVAVNNPVPLSSPLWASAPAIAVAPPCGPIPAPVSSEMIGGVARLEKDPPRYGVDTAARSPAGASR